MKFPDGVTLETERLFIRPLNEDEMKNLADSYIEKDSKMYKALFHICHRLVHSILFVGQLN